MTGGIVEDFLLKKQRLQGFRRSTEDDVTAGGPRRDVFRPV